MRTFFVFGANVIKKRRISGSDVKILSAVADMAAFRFMFKSKGDALAQREQKIFMQLVDPHALGKETII